MDASTPRSYRTRGVDALWIGTRDDGRDTGIVADVDVFTVNGVVGSRICLAAATSAGGVFMKRVMTLALVALLAVPMMAATPTARPEEVGFSAERLQRVHDLVQRHIDA